MSKLPLHALALSSLALLGTDARAQDGVERQILAPPDGASGDGFGYRLQRSGNVAVVASPFDDDLGDTSGSAYVFERDPLAGWSFRRKLVASDGATFDYFSYSLAIDGTNVLVGAPLHDGAGADEGSVYLFARDHGGKGRWGEVARLDAPVPRAGAGFGSPLAVRGDCLAISATHTGQSRPGVVYLYRRDATASAGWAFEREFVAEDPAFGFSFGYALALGDGVLFASGSHIASGHPFTLAVHVFEQDAGGSGNWGETQLIRTPRPGLDYFGSELVLAGERLAVAAPGETWQNFTRLGAMYLYERDDAGTWERTARLTSELAPQHYFPCEELVLGEDWLVAGSLYDAATGSEAGSVTVFHRNAGGPDHWGEVARLQSSVANDEAYFGLEMALEGDELLVGAPEEWYEPGAGSGSVFALDLARLARATWRNDAGGRNLDVHSARSRPLLGTTYEARIDRSTTRHTAATLVAYARAVEVPLGAGPVLLGIKRLGTAAQVSPELFQLAIPPAVQLVGFSFTTQGILFGGGQRTALTNAQDLVLGVE